jgi:hypothetical protein
LILIGHVQLSVEEPHASAPTPRPTARDRPLAATPRSAWGRFAIKSKPDWGAKRELERRVGDLGDALQLLCSPDLASVDKEIALTPDRRESAPNAGIAWRLGVRSGKH